MSAVTVKFNGTISKIVQALLELLLCEYLWMRLPFFQTAPFKTTAWSTYPQSAIVPAAQHCFNESPSVFDLSLNQSKTVLPSASSEVPFVNSRRVLSSQFMEPFDCRQDFYSGFSGSGIVKKCTICIGLTDPCFHNALHAFTVLLFFCFFFTKE